MRHLIWERWDVHLCLHALPSLKIKSLSWSAFDCTHANVACAVVFSLRRVRFTLRVCLATWCPGRPAQGYQPLPGLMCLPIGCRLVNCQQTLPLIYCEYVIKSVFLQKASASYREQTSLQWYINIYIYIKLWKGKRFCLDIKTLF